MCFSAAAQLTSVSTSRGVVTRRCWSLPPHLALTMPTRAKTKSASSKKRGHSEIQKEPAASGSGQPSSSNQSILSLGAPTAASQETRRRRLCRRSSEDQVERVLETKLSCGAVGRVTLYNCSQIQCTNVFWVITVIVVLHVPPYGSLQVSVSWLAILFWCSDPGVPSGMHCHACLLKFIPLAARPRPRWAHEHIQTRLPKPT